MILHDAVQARLKTDFELVLFGYEREKIHFLFIADQYFFLCRDRKDDV